ncbi:MAG: glycosyl hydrolase 53 family protein [Prevotella sp.]|jgi:arabinogalactan endo-1,4-beta-galactosidase|nr:glycosyl hydrolase 53 family protein [Prevotella sp.]
MKRIITSLLLLTALTTASVAQNPSRLVGGDMSLLPSYEAASVKYFTQSGTRINDVLTYVASSEVGWNAIRVRLFVDPAKASDEDKKQGVCQDLDYVTALGKRIKEAGLQFLLDFHYSDSWADPSKQNKPSAWSSMSVEELNDVMYSYTKECLQHLVSNQATPDYIQIGNEISYGMLWQTGRVHANNTDRWDVFAGFLNQGAKACREVCPKARIIIHIERAGNHSYTLNYYTKLDKYNVDYDIIGLSYYPFWHKGLDQLSTTLNTLEKNFPNREVQIVETAYYYQYKPSTGYDSESAPWAVTPAGQKEYVDALIAELEKHSNVTGLYWWFPEENGYQNSVIGSWVNRGLFNNGNGRALPALYALKNFLGTSGIDQPTTDTWRTGGVSYNLVGQRDSDSPIVIVDGRKAINKR